MQSVSQPLLSTLAPDELLQDFEFLCTAGLDSTRIVKNITLMIGEHKFIVNTVLASLTSSLEAIEEM